MTTDAEPLGEMARRRAAARAAGLPLGASWAEIACANPRRGPSIAVEESHTAHAVGQDDGMNKTERAYAQHLEARRLAGEIRRWDREPEKLRLADGTYYLPDFRVIAHDGAIEMHEVKGFWRDDARVKIKVAASRHPYRFIAVYRRHGTWDYEFIRGTV